MRRVAFALCLAACGTAEHRAVTASEPRAAQRPPDPGIDLSIDVRGRRIDVGANGVLHAEGCDAAYFDWERLALSGEHGELVATPDIELGATDRDARADVTPVRRVAAPDGTVLVTLDDHEVRAGERPLFRIDDDGALSDVGTGRVALSTSVPIAPERRVQVLALVALVAVCWETSPRAIPER